MKKIGDVTSTADKNGEWTNGNVAAGIAPTILEAGWLNSVQREILGVLVEAGIAQDKNNDNQLKDAIKKIISGGNYATKTEVNSKLAKDQNGADIPNKPKFIENLGLGEIYATREDVGEKLDKSKVTNSLINSRELVPTTALLIDNLALKQPIGNYQEAGYSYSKTESDNKYQPKGDYARAADLNSLISVGDFMFTSNSEGSITPPWYSVNGDRYGIETPVGKVLKAQSAEWKRAWNVVETAETITLPALLQPDGRMPFLRPVNGTSRKPGSVMGDTIRNFTGELGYEANYGLTTGERDVSGVFRAYGASKGSFTGGGGGRSLNIMFDPSTVVPTGPENKPLDVGAVLKVYLGVKP
ncbi:hypothetical protein ABM023_17460 [Morganella morganii]|uniref:hypothetical protein n=1 Tax=Morganella morganii TaxID=582 RepID=UPI003EBF0B64